MRLLALALAAQGCAVDFVSIGQNYGDGNIVVFDCASGAFCDRFDTPSPGGSAGDLDEATWSVARLDTVNVGQGQHVMVWPTIVEGCGAAIPGALPPGDFERCESGSAAGRMLVSYDSRGNHILQSARIRRPFDFADRLGVISLEIDGQSRTPGGHGFWWNVVLSDEPVPAPSAAAALSATMPRAGVMIEFAAALVCTPSGTAGGGDDLVGGMLVNAWNGVSRIVVFDEYGETDVPITGGADTCFRTAAGVLNRVQIQISRSRIEVFAADAGDPATIRSVASAAVSLPLSRGFVHLQQVSREVDKCTFTTPACTDCDDSPCPVMPTHHTYQWDNVGFDGPALPVPVGHRIADPLAPHALGGVNTGWLLFGDFQASTFGIEPRGMSADGTETRDDPIAIDGVTLAGATRARLTLDAWLAADDETIGYRFNAGTWRSFSPPLHRTGAALALAIPVDLADLRDGSNTLEMSSRTGLTTAANIELVLDTP